VVELVEELKTEARRIEFAVTRVRNGLPDQFREAVAARHLTIAAEIPDDPEIAALDAAGRPLLGVSAGSVALAAVQGLLDKSGVLE
jgi:CO dehydrogenase nickel-insertion accessory protein CooC1